MLPAGRRIPARTHRPRSQPWLSPTHLCGPARLGMTVCAPSQLRKVINSPAGEWAMASRWRLVTGSPLVADQPPAAH
ncbi:hypothetical protein FMEAI12_3080013 [Parafrankia sp. Ea1.12]|nr:hypothetical protein FMEAI12_3080013 [Parafrankia sp. Ea1.12]